MLPKPVVDGPRLQTAKAAVPIQKTYDLQGCVLGIAADDPAVGAFLEPILAPLACTPRTCDWTVALRPADTIEAPPAGRVIFDGNLPEGLPAIMLENDGIRTLVSPGRFSIDLSRAQNTTAARYVPGNAEALSGTAAFWLLADILAANDQHLLHGASLIDPRTDAAIAIFAPSGTGKTTTALALARNGFHFAGDDALVLASDAGACRVWSIPRKPKVDRATAEMLPWLAPCLTAAWTGPEQALSLEGLSDLVTFAEVRPRPVGLVVLLMPPNSTGPQLLKISKPDVLAAIATDNIRIAPGGVDAGNAAALAMLSQLIAGTRALGVSAGPDPQTLAAEIFAL